MGVNFIDKYSLLHFAVGIIAYFWNIPLSTTIVLHILYEIIENTQFGMHFISNYIKIWPGGKTFADTKINSIGDIISTVIGWLFAKYINDIFPFYY